MNKTILQQRLAYLGVDLSKKVFHVCGMTWHGEVGLEKRFTRVQLERFVAPDSQNARQTSSATASGL